MLLIKCNANFNAKIKQIFLNRVFILKTGKYLVPNLWSNLPVCFAAGVINKGLEAGIQVNMAN